MPIARYDKPFAGLVWPSQFGLEWCTKAIERSNYVSLGQPTGILSSGERTGREGSAE
jgi:hypothetical protein